MEEIPGVLPTAFSIVRAHAVQCIPDIARVVFPAIG
jgi:hypothetical protein